MVPPRAFKFSDVISAKNIVCGLLCSKQRQEEWERCAFGVRRVYRIRCVVGNTAAVCSPSWMYVNTTLLLMNHFFVAYKQLLHSNFRPFFVHDEERERKPVCHNSRHRHPCARPPACDRCHKLQRTKGTYLRTLTQHSTVTFVLPQTSTKKKVIVFF